MTNNEGYPVYRGADGKWHAGSFTTKDKAPLKSRIFVRYQTAWRKAAEWNQLEQIK